MPVLEDIDRSQEPSDLERCRQQLVDSGWLTSGYRAFPSKAHAFRLDNFLRGFIQVTFVPCHFASPVFEPPDDLSAIHDDWQMVGRDLWAAILKHADLERESGAGIRDDGDQPEREQEDKQISFDWR